MIDFSLYVILDEKYISRESRNLTKIVEDLVLGGATVIQLREKTQDTRAFLQDALTVRTAIWRATGKFKVPFIVNDRADVALATQADGVHLGESDMPPSHARKILGNKIIGTSVNSVNQALEAVKSGANYVAVGCLFPSSTKSKPLVKLSLISEIKKVIGAYSNTPLQILGIGGITLDKIDKVLNAGADGICVAGDLFNHPRLSELKDGGQANLRERTYKFKMQISKCKREELWQDFQ
ncbi:thiamine phosphate synthase [candidate division WOR-3 bacterium]|nr:thiamine phosphate synthase [candidate division WOR-3 bacterium]